MSKGLNPESGVHTLPPHKPFWGNTIPQYCDFSKVHAHAELRKLSKPCASHSFLFLAGNT